MPSEAAVIASRSVRTIRRAYNSGRLIAYRDLGGRGIRIAYGDLRRWMMGEEVRSPVLEARPPSSVYSPLRKSDRNHHLALIRAARDSRRRSQRF